MWMCALGAGLYAVGIGSVALGHGFWAFVASMVVVSLGEVVLVPTATTLIANLAPPAMRARYMSVYGQSWSISHGFGPVVGGFLNDQVAPRAMWLGGLGWGALAFALFASLAHRRSGKPSLDEPLLSHSERSEESRVNHG
jgi:MFS family permease